MKATLTANAPRRRTIRRQCCISTMKSGVSNHDGIPPANTSNRISAESSYEDVSQQRERRSQSCDKEESSLLLVDRDFMFKTGSTAAGGRHHQGLKEEQAEEDKAVAKFASIMRNLEISPFGSRDSLSKKAPKKQCPRSVGIKKCA